MRYAKRRDENERAIISVLQSAGCAVQQLSDSGVPDLLVSYRDVLYLMEVKLPLGARGGTQRHRASSGGEGDLTAAQVKWWKAWTGATPVVVRNPDEALAAIGVAP